MIKQILDACKALIAAEVARVFGVERWATVTQLSPLRIQLDGEETPLDATPDNLAGPLVVGARVLAVLRGRAVRVYGGPTATQAAQHGWDPTNGQRVLEITGQDSEPSFSLKRFFGTTRMWARWYLAANSTTPEPALYMQTDDQFTGVFRVRGNGQLTMQTGEGSPTLNATRNLPFAMVNGTVVVAATSGQTKSATVTYPANLFTSTANVQITPLATNPAVVQCGIGGASSTGFTVYVTGTYTGNLTFHWLAVQTQVT